MAHNFWILNLIDDNAIRMNGKHIIELYKGGSFEVPLKLKVWNLNYGNEIVLDMIYINFEIISQTR